MDHSAFGLCNCYLHGCPCGFYGDTTRACTCSPAMVTRYQKRISGPLLDRIDIHVEVARVEYEKLSDQRLGEPSARIRERVERARQIQARRFANRSVTVGVTPVYGEEEDLELTTATPKPPPLKPAVRPMLTNAEMGPAEVREFCQVDSAGQALLKAATRQLQLSARAYHRVLKLSRTIADLSGAANIQASHIAEAIQYRRKESN